MMEYFYRIYGLRVQSQIPFSEAVPEIFLWYVSRKHTSV